MTMRRTYRRLSTIGVAAALVAALPGSASADRGAYDNWHVHDGGSGTDESGLVHPGLALFPAILTGGNVDAYLSDPAYCPDATDKFLLPNGANDMSSTCGRSRQETPRRQAGRQADFRSRAPRSTTS